MIEQFEKYHLFRRLILVFLCVMYAYVTIESFSFARFGVNHGVSATDIVIIIGSLQTLMSAVIGYAFKIYSTSRDQNEK